MHFYLNPDQKKQIIAFAIIFIFQLVFNTLLSPISWGNPLLSYRSTSSGGVFAVSTPLFRSQYVNSKLYDFSGFDSSYWGTGNNSPTLLYSAIVPWLTFALNLPSIDVLAFHKLLFGILFMLFVIGSYGFYLFLNKSLRISHEVALLGGLLFTFSNGFFGNISNIEYPAFISPYLILPFGLYFFTLAIRKASLKNGMIAGVIMALPFYILAPHPEAVIHFITLFSAFSLWLILFEKGMTPFWKKLLIGICCAIAFAIASASYLVPILIKFLSREIITFGHQQGNIFNYGLLENFRFIFPMLVLGSPFLFWIIHRPKSLIEKNDQRSIILFFIIVIFISAYVFFPGNSSRLNIWMQYRFPQINFLEEMRSLSYVFLSLLVVGLYSFNAALTSKYAINKRILLFPICLAVVFVYIFITPFIYPWPEVKSFDNAHYLNMLDLPYLLNIRITQLLHGDQLVSLSLEIIICSTLILLLYFLLRNSHKIESQIQHYLKKKGIYIKSIPKEFYLLIIVFLFIYFNPASSQLKSSRLIDNPTDCKPYITMQTLLTNYQGLRTDPAKLILIKNRIVNYEKTLQKGQIENGDASQFNIFLNEFHAVSASNLSGNEIISFGEKVQPMIDLHYLENDSCPKTGWYDLSGKSFGRVAEYNYAATLSGVTERTSRILFTIQSDGALGVAEGKNIQNGTTSIDTRFMSSLPAINALYLIPGMNFSNFPQYNGYTPWNLMAGEVLGNQSRTLMNISGIDYFVINSKDYLQEFSNAPQWQFKWSSKVLPEGKHILKIIPVISTESDSAFLTLDAIQVVSGKSDNPSSCGVNERQIFDDRSSLIQYFGSWVQKNENPDSYQRTYTYTFDPNAFLVFPFQGSGIEIIYPINAAGGLGDVYIDDQFVGRINQSMGERMDWSNLELIKYNTPEVVDPQFTLLKNSASYGLAYFAKSVKYIDPELKNLFLKQYKPPFYYLEREKYVAYLDTVNKMRSFLQQIIAKNGILIERPASLDNSQENQIHENLQGEILDSNMVSNKAVFKVQCEISPCTLIFNMADNNGWHAYIDNQETITREANFAFLSVDVPKGQHLVWFEYQPGYLFITLCLSFMMYIFALFSMVLLDDENDY